MSFYLEDVLFDDYETVEIGEGTKIWNKVHIGRYVDIGNNCMIGDNIYIGDGVDIGDGCRIQNNAFIPKGVAIGDNVFIGPNVTFTNVKYPRADKRSSIFSSTYVYDGASVGANSTILCGIKLFERCVIGAGSVVTRSVDPYTIVAGNPARKIGIACECGYNVYNEPKCSRCGAMRGKING